MSKNKEQPYRSSYTPQDTQQEREEVCKEIQVKQARATERRERQRNQEDES